MKSAFAHTGRPVPHGVWGLHFYGVAYNLFTVLILEVLANLLKKRKFRKISSNLLVVKFIYSGKATKFCKISSIDLTVTMYDQSRVEISQNFVDF